MPANSPQYLVIGKILRPHGIRGELRLRLFTDYPERIGNDVARVYLSRDEDGKTAQPHSVEAMRMHHEYGLLKLEEIDDRNDADRLRNLFVLVALEDAIPLEDGEIYLYQLIGLDVVTETGTALGTIADVLETGANDVYIVQGDTYGEVLIPATDETILSTDIAQNRLTVRLPDGLLDLG